MSNAEAMNLEAISKAIDYHGTICDGNLTGILMNPYEVQRLDWDEIRGIPIKEDPSVPNKSFRLECDKGHGSPAPAAEIEDTDDKFADFREVKRPAEPIFTPEPIHVPDKELIPV